MPGLLDAVAAGVGIARAARGVPAFLGGAHHAIELHRVAAVHLFSGDAAEIGLVGALAGDAIGDIARIRA